MPPTARTNARRFSTCALSAALLVQVAPADGDGAVAPSPRSSLTVGASGGGGRYGMTCGGVRAYRVSGASARYTRQRARHSAVGVEARAFTGHDRGADDGTTRLPIRGGALIGHFERRLYGVAYGFAVGSLAQDGARLQGSLISRVRLGPQRVHAYVDAGSEEPLGFPRPGLQLGLGATLPGERARGRFGLAEDGVAGGFALSLPRGLEIEPFGVYGDRLDGTGEGRRGSRAFHFSVVARKRFELGRRGR